MVRKWVIVLALFTVILASGGCLAALGLQPTDCYLATLSRPIDWATSGVWSEDGTLLVVDLLQEEVLRVNPRGGQVESILAEQLPWATALRSQPLPLPSAIRAAADGGYYLEEDRENELFRVNRYLEYSGSIAVKNRRLGTEKATGVDVTLKAVWDWTPMAQGILAFGDLQAPDDTWQSAFVYFDDSGRNQVFHTVEIADEVRSHYVRSTSRYLAALGEVGYILFMDPKPSIGKVTLGHGVGPRMQHLQYFPEDFRSCPRLKRRSGWPGSRQATKFYEEMEASTMSAGLYAREGYLYILAREVSEKRGKTAWWLIKLDPRKDAEEGRVRLPVDAAHLTVVPGEFWAFIEKGPVQGIGDTDAPYMDTSSVVFVPAEWIEDTTNSPLGPDSRRHCEPLR